MKINIFPRILFFVAISALASLNSCQLINSNIMLVAGRNYPFDTLSKDTTIAKEYRLNANDIIEFRLFANDGFKMIDIISSTIGNQANAVFRQGFEYTLDNNGMVKLPILDSVILIGMTIAEAQDHLELRYSEFYVSPFVLVKVLNKRVIIYPGEPGMAKVVPLQNNNTTVIEALALAGGISGNGKAYNIKLIRKTNNPDKPFKVYRLNLSKLSTGLLQGNTIVQSNDIIIVEPRRQLAGKILKEIAPILSLISSFVTLYVLVTRFP
ncbi:MAG TPA: polysaccharide biosynthesis/export family protein [Bacteroidia bacterium]|nr:polysaccharide biosynthesis/export family protein [Bacteroidia bacterium]